MKSGCQTAWTAWTTPAGTMVNEHHQLIPPFRITRCTHTRQLFFLPLACNASKREGARWIMRLKIGFFDFRREERVVSGESTVLMSAFLIRPSCLCLYSPAAIRWSTILYGSRSYRANLRSFLFLWKLLIENGAFLLGDSTPETMAKC